MLRRFFGLLALFGFVVASVHADTITVHAFNFDFTTDPSHNTIVDPVIHVGDTIHWVVNQGTHCTKACAGMSETWSSNILGVGGTFDHTFTHAGTFGYICCLHGSDNGNGTGSGMAGTITVLPAETPPSSFQIVRGALISGGLSDLLQTDDLRMKLRAAVPPPPQIGTIPGPPIDPLQLIVTGTSPVQTPTSFKFKLEANAQVLNISQSIDLFDYSANTFVTVDVRPATTIDSVVEITATNPTRFVNSSNKEVKARLRWRATGSVPFPGWQVGIDQTVWNIQ